MKGSWCEIERERGGRKGGKERGEREREKKKGAMQTVQMPKCINFATILQLPSWQPTLCVNWPGVNQISLYSDNLRTMYGIQCSCVGLILKLFFGGHCVSQIK